VEQVIRPRHGNRAIAWSVRHKRLNGSCGQVLGTMRRTDRISTDADATAGTSSITRLLAGGAKWGKSAHRDARIFHLWTPGEVEAVQRLQVVEHVQILIIHVVVVGE